MPLTLPKTLLAAAAALVLTLAACTSTAGAAALPGAKISTQHLAQAATYPGLQHQHYEYGPINIVPGQNTIDFRPAGKGLKPSVPGYITSFRPNLIYSSNRKVPRVDVIHLHHGVWIMKGNPTFAAGEEKTTFFAPHGYGYHYDPHDPWILNYMLHNLTPTPTKVTITYDIDFVPDSEAAASSITPIHPMWLDVSGIKAYPVFNAIRGTGKNGKYTFPDMARGAEKRNVGPAHQWVVDRDLTLVGTGGHVHPGGLYTDLTATRNGKTMRLFRSQAKYFEPAGAVSWDVAMTVTKPNWRPTLKRGDLVDVHATYDISKASWYETMGIMVTWYADGTQADGKDPFTSGVDTSGILTHGHLPENRNHGGSPVGLPDPSSMLSGPPTNNVNIKDFTYGRGDLANRGRLPVVKRGHSLTFTNLDAESGTPLDQAAYHTITACKSPCNKLTGIAYPIANGGRQFDSAELGYGPSFATAAANRNTWSTPKNLPRGTYTYFCRIHPFMRGAFRVK